MSHILVPELFINAVSGIAAIIVLSYTIRANGLFRGLSTLQRPWQVMMIAVVLLIVNSFTNVIRVTFHLGPISPIGVVLSIVVGATLLGFVIALAYFLMTFVRVWTPREGRT